VIHGVKGLDDDADFAEEQRSDPERAAKVPMRQVGPTLARPQANRLLEWLER
jgi:hypothetical protein